MAPMRFSRKLSLFVAAITCLCIVHVEAAEPFATGFNAPVSIHVEQQGGLLVSNWGSTTVDRVGSDGSRVVFLRDIPSPAGIAADQNGAVFVSSYSGNHIVRVAPDGSRETVAEGLSTPTGLAFARDGRLLVANRSSGEIIAIDTETGKRSIVARSLSLPVGVVEMPDGSLVVSQYGGRVTRIRQYGLTDEIGHSFNRPGVGILADGSSAVLVVDYGAGVVRHVAFDGQSSIVADGFSGSIVALGRAPNGDLLVGTWGSGNLYRVAAPAQ